MAARETHEEQAAAETGGRERRAYPRHAVDCPVIVFPVSGSAQVQGRLTDLSLGGCRVAAEQRYAAGILLRAEVQFQLRGIAFRIVGVTVGSRDAKIFAVRFLDMPARRKEELAEVLEEVAAANAAKLAAEAIAEPPAPDLPATNLFAPNLTATNLTAVAAPASAGEAASQAPAVAAAPIEPISPVAVDAGSCAENVTRLAEPAKAIEAQKTIAPIRPAERRSQNRHAVDTSAKLLLIKTAICMPGRILNLSLGGCRIRTEERFDVGIYVRVEAEFYLHGLPFRVGGVSQAILDRNTIGVRFLDMSERRRDQLSELMAEIAEAAAAEPSAGLAGIVDPAESSR